MTVVKKNNAGDHQTASRFLPDITPEEAYQLDATKQTNRLLSVNNAHQSIITGEEIKMEDVTPEEDEVAD